MSEIDLKLKELKPLIGETDPASRAKFEEIMAYLDAHKDDPGAQEKLQMFFDAGMKQMGEEIEQLRAQIEENTYEILPLSYIAKNYFNKSRAWLYQRLNGYEVRGHRYTLNEKEKETFNMAIQDIAQRIGSVRIA